MLMAIRIFSCRIAKAYRDVSVAAAKTNIFLDKRHFTSLFVFPAWNWKLI